MIILKRITIVFLMIIFAINYATGNVNAYDVANAISKSLDSEQLIHFTPNNLSDFYSLSDDTIILVYNDQIVRKKDLDINGKVSLSSFDLYDRTSNYKTSSGIQEVIVYKPTGMFTAVSYHTVSTTQFFQETTSYFFTPNRANLFIAQNQTNTFNFSLNWLVYSALVGIKYFGPYIAVVLGFKDLLTVSFFSEIAQRSTNNKCVNISFMKNRYGSFRAVKDWNCNSIVSRNGTQVTNQWLTTTEKTEIQWSPSP